jgi:hypothetical protein
MFPRQSTTNPKQLPLRAGVGLQASAEEDPTHIVTHHWVLIVPILYFRAKMPKPVEMEYVQQAVVDYFRDHSVFQYTYPYPFDPQDVDVILRVRPVELRCDNLTPYSSGLTLVSQFFPPPPLSLLVLLLAPQERFTGKFALEFTLETPKGEEIAVYELNGKDTQWVWIYSQPFANYMWYNSVFRTQFLQVMDGVRTRIEQDSDQIMAAAGQEPSSGERVLPPVRP